MRECETMSPMTDITIVSISGDVIEYKMTRSANVSDRMGGRYPKYITKQVNKEMPGIDRFLFDNLQVGKRYHIDQLRDKNKRIYWVVIVPLDNRGAMMDGDERVLGVPKKVITKVEDNNLNNFMEF